MMRKQFNDIVNDISSAVNNVKKMEISHSYKTGMINGLILAKSIITGNEEVFINVNNINNENL